MTKNDAVERADDEFCHDCISVNSSGAQTRSISKSMKCPICGPKMRKWLGGDEALQTSRPGADRQRALNELPADVDIMEASRSTKTEIWEWFVNHEETIRAALKAGDKGRWQDIPSDLKAGRYLVVVQTDDGQEVHSLERDKKGDWWHDGEQTFCHSYYFEPVMYQPLPAPPDHDINAVTKDQPPTSEGV